MKAKEAANSTVKPVLKKGDISKICSEANLVCAHHQVASLLNKNVVALQIVVESGLNPHH